MRHTQNEMGLLHSLTTPELVEVHNLLDGGAWLKSVRFVLSHRQIWDRHYIASHVGAHSWDCISGRYSR